LGNGAIRKEGANIRGLNTAATLWASAAVGACAGANYEIIVATNVERAAEMPDILHERLQAANCPIRENQGRVSLRRHVEVAAESVALAAEPDELDAVVAGLSELPAVNHATRHVSAPE
jgi:putative Mg2+ transporter-C (MgtC) family protein